MCQKIPLNYTQNTYHANTHKGVSGENGWGWRVLLTLLHVHFRPVSAMKNFDMIWRLLANALYITCAMVITPGTLVNVAKCLQ
mmetsp:Transcript_24469/g.61949  ORF Transcript_24469/g.61949 Transcript_24469/m.61949 type:complete len:83 (-) Transcript_24469:382-630(-)